MKWQQAAGVRGTGSRVGQGSYLTVHNGLLLFQLHLLLPSLSTQQSLQDRPFREATFLLQGCLTVWGQAMRVGVRE
jgi:hypothetical protein